MGVFITNILKMSEIMRERLKASKGFHAKIFLNNGFKYEGTITSCDDEDVEILEPERGYKIIKIENISDVNIFLKEFKKEGEENE